MAVFLALACLLQEPGAEDTFKKIEESIEKARTLRVKFKLEGHGAKEGPDRELKASGSLWLKEGNRVRVELKAFAGGKEHEMTAVSDGAQMVTLRDGREGESRELPKNLRARIDVSTARMGPFMAAMFGGARRPGKPDDQDPKKLLEMRDIKGGDGDAQGKTLSYTLRLEGDGNSADVKLWYDAKTLALAKREITVRRNGVAEGTITETYEEYVLNGDIPDDTFKVGGVKPKEEKKDEKK